MSFNCFYRTSQKNDVNQHQINIIYISSKTATVSLSHRRIMSIIMKYTSFCNCHSTVSLITEEYYQSTWNIHQFTIVIHRSTLSQNHCQSTRNKHYIHQFTIVIQLSFADRHYRTEEYYQTTRNKHQFAIRNYFTIAHHRITVNQHEINIIYISSQLTSVCNCYSQIAQNHCQSTRNKHYIHQFTVSVCTTVSQIDATRGCLLYTSPSPRD